MRKIYFCITALFLIGFTSIAQAQNQRTKIAIVGLVPFALLGFVTKLNQTPRSVHKLHKF